MSKDDLHEITFRNPIQQFGFAMAHHVMVLDPALSDAALRTYLLYLRYAQQKAICWPSTATIAAERGKNRGTIQRHITELEQLGYITRERRGDGQTARTVIEDITQIDRLKPLAAAKIRSRKNARSETADRAKMRGLNGSDRAKMRDKEEQDQENNNNQRKNNHQGPAPEKTAADGGGVFLSPQAQLFLEFGISLNASTTPLLEKDIETIKEWMNYVTENSDGIRNPQGRVIAGLRSGYPPPKDGNGSEPAPDPEISAHRARRTVTL